MYRLTISSSGTGGLAGSAEVIPMLMKPTRTAMKNDLKTLLIPGLRDCPLILEVFHTLYQRYYQNAIPKSY
jgi:hypothetical protein